MLDKILKSLEKSFGDAVAGVTTGWLVGTGKISWQVGLAVVMFWFAFWDRVDHYGRRTRHV